MQTTSNIVQVFSISIHAPREGGDHFKSSYFMANKDFNPRPPRGGRLGYSVFFFWALSISIHAPREGGDVIRFIILITLNLISIHAPREGGDTIQ